MSIFANLKRGKMDIPTLAIIVPCYNEELCLDKTINRLIEVLNGLAAEGKIKSDSYIYLVDDGSHDSTWQIIEKHHALDNRIKGTKFIRNFGNQKGLIAGLESLREIGCECAV